MRNWWAAPLSLVSGQRLKFRDGTQFSSTRDGGIGGLLWQFKLRKVKEKLSLSTTPDGVEFQYLGRRVSLSAKGEHRWLVEGPVYTHFFLDDYALLEVKNKDVLDIGANIGDSSVYFVLRGANHVYAVEPFPSAYEEAVKNASLNEMQEQITCVKAALATESGITRANLGEASVGRIASIEMKESYSGDEIRRTTIGELAKEFNLRSCVLKMGCEGCEYSLLKTDPEILRRFDEILVEYHHGYLNLKSLLEGVGFAVRLIGPLQFSRDRAFGLLFARRRGGDERCSGQAEGKDSASSPTRR